MGGGVERCHFIDDIFNLNDKCNHLWVRLNLTHLTGANSSVFVKFFIFLWILVYAYLMMNVVVTLRQRGYLDNKLYLYFVQYYNIRKNSVVHSIIYSYLLAFL